MFDKFYNFIIPTFQNVELSTTDTDSFLFSCSIPKEDTLVDILKRNEDQFDFSNLSRDGRLGKSLFSMDHKNELNR